MSDVQQDSAPVQDRTRDDHYGRTRHFHDVAARERDGFYDSTPGQSPARQHSRWQRRARALVLNILDTAHRQSPIGTVLDVGCGRGDFTRLLATRYAGAHVLGADFSPGMIALAEQEPAANVTFASASLPALDIGGRRFDFVVCLNVLHHVHAEDQGAALDQLAARAQRGLVIEIKNAGCPYKRLRRGLHLRDGTRVYPTTVRRVADRLRPAGWTCMAQHPIFGIGVLSPIVVLGFAPAAREVEHDR